MLRLAAIGTSPLGEYLSTSKDPDEATSSGLIFLSGGNFVLITCPVLGGGSELSRKANSVWSLLSVFIGSSRLNMLSTSVFESSLASTTGTRFCCCDWPSLKRNCNPFLFLEETIFLIGLGCGFCLCL